MESDVTTNKQRIDKVVDKVMLKDNPTLIRIIKIDRNHILKEWMLN